jgi:hypothetical protein
MSHGRTIRAKPMRRTWIAMLWAAAVPAAAQPLDFQAYRTAVEPIFLKARPAIGPGGPCFSCHTHIHTRFRLEPLAPEAPAWSEAQSRRNFEAVSRLVVPGAPEHSPLLLHALAVEAGGHALHAGGKQWRSREDPEWQAIAAWVKRASAGDDAPPRQALDYEAFKATVQPAFARKRSGLARCWVCHSQGTNFRIQPLPVGSGTWSEEASRKNFESVQRLVVSGDPFSSRLLMQPLASQAGGEHWASTDDPEFQALAAWVRGKKVER